MLKGIGVSAGIGLAPAVVLAVSELVIPTAKPADLEAEKAAFWAAHAKVLSDTHALAEKTAAEIGSDEAAVFEAHAMLLEDPTLTDPIVQAIERAVKTPPRPRRTPLTPSFPCSNPWTTSTWRRALPICAT